MRSMRELFVGIFVAFALLSSDAGAANAAPAGTVLLIKGDVHIIDTNAKVVADIKGEHGRRKLDVNAPFYVGETLVTKEGRVKLRFVEGNNEVVVGTNTSLLIERASTDPLKATGTSLSLARGEVRSSVNHKYSGKGGDVYEVKTPNAVAGVRGTVFLARFNPKTFKSEVATERGLVAVKNIGAGPGREVMVQPGMFTSTAGAAAPAAPAPISKNPDLEQSVKSMGGSGDSKGSDEGGTKASEVGPTDNKQDAAKNDAGNKQDAAPAQSAEAAPAKSDDKSSNAKSDSGQKQDSGTTTAKSEAKNGDSSAIPAKSDAAPAKSDSNSMASSGGASGSGTGSTSGSATASNSNSSSSSSGGSSAPLGREPVTPGASSSGANRSTASVGVAAPPSVAGLPSNPAGPPLGSSGNLSPISDIASKAINNASATATTVNRTVNQQTQQVQRITGKGIIKIQ